LEEHGSSRSTRSSRLARLARQSRTCRVESSRVEPSGILAFEPKSVMPYHSAERTSTVVHFYVIRQLNAILLLGENFHVSNYYFVLNK